MRTGDKAHGENPLRAGLLYILVVARDYILAGHKAISTLDLSMGGNRSMNSETSDIYYMKRYIAEND